VIAARRRCLAGLAAALLLAACGGEEAAYRPEFGPGKDTSAKTREYRIAVYPLNNPERMFALYGPIVDHLNGKLSGARFVLETSRNYAEFEQKLYARQFDLALANPYQTLNAIRHGYQVFGKMADDDHYHGIILTRRDGPVRTAADLKGRAVSFPAPTALAACLLPQHYLRQQGLALEDYQARYVGSQESSIMAVLLGDAAAGATWPPFWDAFQEEHPEQAAQLQVLWHTPALPSPALLARDDLPPAVLAQVSGVLFGLHLDAAGRALLTHLHLPRFEPAGAAAYQPVREFLAQFSQTVRPLPDLP
jgi:phosphonate transport system substrate-binding protein